MRILIPLDGSALARTVVPEATQLAGKNGQLVLIRDAIGPLPGGTEGASPEVHAVELSEAYLHDIAAPMRDSGLDVRVEAFFMADPADAIDEAARLFDVDLIACATEARAGLQRLVHPSVAWRALSRSPVPVLLHRGSAQAPTNVSRQPLRLLVPLDGSDRSELAVPVATQIAQECGGSIVLVRVVPSHDAHLPDHRSGETAETPLSTQQAEAQAYLSTVAAATAVECESLVLTGSVGEQLIGAVTSHDITHVVMSSHGRTGWARVILGSVADDLVHAVETSVVVVPATAGQRGISRGTAASAANDRLAGVR